MTDDERDRLRALQDRWLAQLEVKNHIERHGWDARITHLQNGPTFRDVRDMVIGSWEAWFVEYLEGVK